MNQIGQWLRAARLAQRHPVTGRPWSQEYAVERIREEASWPTLYRPNYVGYENGRGMEPETLDRLARFWAGYGVEAPRSGPAAPERTLEERAVLAAERQAAALERIAEVMAFSAFREQMSADERLAQAGSLMSGRPTRNHE